MWKPMKITIAALLAIGAFVESASAAITYVYGVPQPFPMTGDPPTQYELWANGLGQNSLLTVPSTSAYNVGADGVPFLYGATRIQQHDIFEIDLNNVGPTAWAGFHVEISPESVAGCRGGDFSQDYLVFGQPYKDQNKNPLSFARVNGQGGGFTVAQNCYQEDIDFQNVGLDDVLSGQNLHLTLEIAQGTTRLNLNYHLLMYPIADEFRKHDPIPEPSGATVLFSSLALFGIISVMKMFLQNPGMRPIGGGKYPVR